jgi:hypothetical protein
LLAAGREDAILSRWNGRELGCLSLEEMAIVEDIFVRFDKHGFSV